MHGLFCIWNWAVVTIAWASATGLAAEEFRIQTEVYSDGDEKPISESVTLFESGVVYDFLSSPAQIAVFSGPTADRPGRFILLNPDRELRTELSTERIERALQKVSGWASQQADPMLRFAAEPQFNETFTPSSGELILASHLQTYRLSTRPAPRPAALNQYREFLDWYARLNALHSRLPPQPRLAVNAALTKYEVVPLEVELTQPGGQPALRAMHDFTWRLSQQDRARINEVRDAMTNYDAVSNESFLAWQEKPVED